MDIIKKNFELIQEGRDMTPSTVNSTHGKAATAEALRAVTPSSMVYVELVVLDALSQLRANLNHLEDLYNRFGFMMREISYLTRK